MSYNEYGRNALRKKPINVRTLKEKIKELEKALEKQEKYHSKYEELFILQCNISSTIHPKCQKFYDMYKESERLEKNLRGEIDPYGTI